MKKGVNLISIYNDSSKQIFEEVNLRMEKLSRTTYSIGSQFYSQNWRLFLIKINC
jgi:glutathionyl-hydroquinone reductase